LVKTFLWVLGSIVVLDVLLVGVIAACVAIVRRRGPAQLRDPVTWWPLETSGPRPRALSAISTPPDERELEPTPIRRARVRLVPEADTPRQRPRRRRLDGRRLAGVALLTALVVAGTAFASPQVRRFVTTAIGAVSGGLGSGTVAPSGQAADDPNEPSAQSDASQTPAVSDPRTGRAPDRGSSPGPAVDGRPAGVPHTGVLTPGSPTTVTAVPGGSGQIVVAWGDVAGETTYRIERSSDGGGAWTTAATVGQDVTSATDGGLTAGTTYFYRVLAENGDLASEPSDVASATTSIDVPSSTQVTIVATTADRIDLSWDDVTGETGYRIERSSDGGAGWIAIATTGQDVTAATDAGLEADTTYWYRVVATNAAGDSAPSAAVAATTDPGGVAEDPGTTRDPLRRAEV
jgi:fibronectin type III domain protein